MLHARLPLPVAVALLLGGPLPAAAQTTVDVSAGRSGVTIHGTPLTWWTTRVQLSRVAPERGGLFFAADTEDRGADTSTLVSASGYRRMDDWTVYGLVGGAPGADFLPRFTMEAEVSRRVAGTVVAHGRYIGLRYGVARVHLASPAVTWYHARGEVSARGYLGWETVRDDRSRALLVRADHRLTPAWRVDGGVAAGRRIFAILNQPDGGAAGRLAYGVAWRRLGRAGELGVGAFFAHEDPALSRRTLTIAFRRSL